jgi:hypothetical protein
VTDIGWRLFGRVTEKMRAKGCGLPNDAVARIPAQLNSVLNTSVSGNEDDAAWRPLIAQMAIAVANAGRGERLQKFNGNFGLFRGLCAALVTLCAYAAFEHLWLATAILIVLVWATRFRMKRFSKYYARELWMQFLALDA